MSWGKGKLINITVENEGNISRIKNVQIKKYKYFVSIITEDLSSSTERKVRLAVVKEALIKERRLLRGKLNLN